MVHLKEGTERIVRNRRHLNTEAYLGEPSWTASLALGFEQPACVWGKACVDV